MAYKRTSPMPVVEGGTGNSTLTTHTVLLGNGTSPITQLTNGTTGQVLTAVTGADPQWATPSGGTLGSVLGSREVNLLFATPGIRYACPFFNNGSVNATIGLSQMVIPMDGTIDRLYVRVYTNANTASGTATLNINGSTTALVATVTALTTGTFSDTSNSVNVSQGDLMTIQFSQATTGNATGMFSCRFMPT